MMVRKLMAAASIALLACTAPAAAQEVETQALQAKNIASGKEQLDPSKGYIFAKSANRSNALFIKTPDEADIAEYQADWEEEYEKAVRKYPGRLKRWKANKEANRNPGPKPIEPTRESFSIQALDVRMMAGYGPMKVFSKEKSPDGEKIFTYLTELEPGTYTYYGPIFYAPGAQMLGTCYCMGSVKFEVKAGEITNLGDFLAEGWVDLEARKQATIFWENFGDRQAFPADYTVPANLTGLPVVQADFRASGKRNNVLNLAVGRMPPVEGVLAYDRDTPIDVKGELARKQAEEAAQLAAAAVADAASATAEAAEEAAEAAAEAVGDEPASN